MADRPEVFSILEYANGARSETRRHELKTWPAYFAAIVRGEKTFEVRHDDRDFQVGDVLSLREWNPETKSYTGECIDVRVTYVLKGSHWLAHGSCAMSIQPYLPAAPGGCLHCGGPCTRDLIDAHGRPYKGCPIHSRYSAPAPGPAKEEP